LEATELALLARVSTTVQLEVAWDMARRATTAFNQCMCGSTPDKPAVGLFGFLVHAILMRDKKKKRKKEEEEEEAVEFANDGQDFVDYWIGVRRVNGVTTMQQKSVLVPTEGPLCSQLSSESFWGKLVDEEE
jgi:hypothetical protein